jgi:hypothetical protein
VYFRNYRMLARILLTVTAEGKQMEERSRLDVARHWRASTGVTTSRVAETLCL